MAKIMEMMAILPRATVAKVCKPFRYWIEALVEAGGDFFSYSLILHIEVHIICEFG
jgi:hypothetical protein